MTITPEIERPQAKPEGVVKETPEVVDVPPSLQEQGVTPTPTQITSQVSDQGGAPLMQSPATQTVTVTIPTTQQQLADWSQGSAESSLTWFAMFWLRIVKKAIHFGWRVITKGGEKNAGNV